MTKTHYLFCLIAISLLSMSLHTLAMKRGGSVVPARLLIEYIENPTGVDVLKPRFSWVLEATSKTAFGQRQTAYRVLVASTTRLLAKEEGDVWDSGWVNSDQMQHIAYGGRKLH